MRKGKRRRRRGLEALSCCLGKGSRKRKVALGRESEGEGEDGEEYEVSANASVSLAAGDAFLATIQEDIEEETQDEEDEGREEERGEEREAEDEDADEPLEDESGHWLFSADTDTDSVIHVPYAEAKKEKNEENRDREKGEEGPGNGVGPHPVPRDWSSGFPNYSSNSSSFGRTAGDAGPPETACASERPRSFAEAGVSASGGVSDASAGDSKPSVGDSDVPPSGPRRGDMATASECVRDDVFDFDSLESCEVVVLQTPGSGGGGGGGGSSSAGVGAQDGRGWSLTNEESEAVFNTSATSEPFSDGFGRAGRREGKQNGAGIEAQKEAQIFDFLGKT
ncbi:uncharacterized protein LOC119569262, partial [Penaeus monodon]|uniref:uncharacterized protein LOC119569262 n=1 Tax=Penaeus monodon TaxID=6687 RepID=UPI0018A6FE62